MKLEIRRNSLVIILDTTNNDVLCFGEGVEALRAATEFMNRIFLAEHAAYCAGFAH